MNQKSIAEIRRRLNAGKRMPEVIYGCYVSPEGEILANFRKTVSMLPQQEVEQYMTLFRKVLSGTQGQQLLPVNFLYHLPEEDDAYSLLIRLYQKRLQNEEDIRQLFGAVIMGIMEENKDLLQSVEGRQQAPGRLILLLGDSFDTGTRHDGEYVDPEQMNSVFSYYLCCICPVKPGKEALSFIEKEGDFHCLPVSWPVSMPESGFLFPCFEQGGADVHTAMFYTRDSSNPHDSLMEQVFHTRLDLPAPAQQHAMQELLQDSLGDECTMELIQGVHERLSDILREQKEDRLAEPVHLTVKDIGYILEDCGISAEKKEIFDAECRQTFGEQAEIPAVNLLQTKDFRVKTPRVSIRVDPEHAELVSTRVIDGQRCIVILADGAVEVNGVCVSLEETKIKEE